MDFNDAQRGEWITTKWLATAGLTVHVEAPSCGFVKMINGLRAARVFDTSNPGTTSNGDPDLGSPNQGCQYYQGDPWFFKPNVVGTPWPGIGLGGDPRTQPVQEYWNCVPQGMVLIVDENGDGPGINPDDAACGGTIVFTINDPSFITTLGIIDVDDNGIPVQVIAKDAAGQNHTHLSPNNVGNNGLYKMTLNIPNVVEVRVRFPGSGAVSYLNYEYCPGVTIEQAPTKQPTKSPTKAPTKVSEHAVSSIDHFFSKPKHHTLTVLSSNSLRLPQKRQRKLLPKLPRKRPRK
jgi:hypothetical protein